MMKYIIVAVKYQDSVNFGYKNKKANFIPYSFIIPFITKKPHAAHGVSDH